MTRVLAWLTREAAPWVAGLLIALSSALALYAKGRADGKSDELRKADKAYRNTREKMDAVETGDDAGALRNWLRRRGQPKRGL